MLRAFSTRNGQGRYERLGGHGEQDTGILLEAKLERSKSYPSSRVLGAHNKVDQELAVPVPAKPPPKKANLKNHPLFSLFDSRRKKKITAKPEFARYLEYVKEGGIWGPTSKSNAPVSYK